MHATLTTLLNKLDSPALAETSVIKWGAPVPSFGDASVSLVATLGLNPSNREFVDERGQELQDDSRRFHTLKSLALSTWSDAEARHLQLILESCSMYFRRNPYDRWFKRLDQIVCGTGTSFYTEMYPACHLDLIPYATSVKWTDLHQREKGFLLAISADALGLLLRESPVRVLILNGQTVVEQFEQLAGAPLGKIEMSAWTLPRESGRAVCGYAYCGSVDRIGHIGLNHSILVLGYNHNIQSSFGVTSRAVFAIRDWIATKSRGAI